MAVRTLCSSGDPSRQATLLTAMTRARWRSTARRGNRIANSTGWRSRGGPAVRALERALLLRRQQGLRIARGGRASVVEMTRIPMRISEETHPIAGRLHLVDCPAPGARRGLSRRRNGCVARRRERGHGDENDKLSRPTE